MTGTKRIYWMAQFIGWSAYALFSYVANFMDRPSELSLKYFFMLFIFSFTGLSLTHVMRMVLVNRGWIDLRFRELLPRLGMLVLFLSFILANVEMLISILFSDTGFHQLWEQYLSSGFYLNLIGAMLLLAIWNGIYFIYHFFNKAYVKEMDNLKLQSSQHEIELKNLKSQLNPHFLFNSLNTIRALIEVDPTVAKQTVTRLSNLLRSSLVTGKKDTITLQEELEIVQNYLALEKIRFEERLQIEIEIDPALLRFEIPPFMIQTLAENAIKHGISRELEGGLLKIKVTQIASVISIQVLNTGRIEIGKIDIGIGIENTKRRLALMFKNKARFELYEKAGHVISEIQIKDSYE